jgi:hypothetical protein
VSEDVGLRVRRRRDSGYSYRVILEDSETRRSRLRVEDLLRCHAREWACDLEYWRRRGMLMSGVLSCCHGPLVSSYAYRRDGSRVGGVEFLFRLSFYYGRRWRYPCERFRCCVVLLGSECHRGFRREFVERAARSELNKLSWVVDRFVAEREEWRVRHGG